jgi:hypothetical protein
MPYTFTLELFSYPPYQFGERGPGKWKLEFTMSFYRFTMPSSKLIYILLPFILNLFPKIPV